MEISELRDSIMSQSIDTQLAVKCIKMAHESDKVIGSLIEDTAEISKDAMNRYLAEINQA